MFHDNGQKFSIARLTSKYKDDRTRWALQHIKNFEACILEKSYGSSKNCQKSIKLAYLKAFFAHNFFIIIINIICSWFQPRKTSDAIQNCVNIILIICFESKKNHLVSSYQSAYSARHMHSIVSTILFLTSTQNSGVKMAETFLDKSPCFCKGVFFRLADFFLEKSLKNDKKIASKVLLLARLCFQVVIISFFVFEIKKWLWVFLINYCKNLHMKINSDVNLCNLGVFMVWSGNLSTLSMETYQYLGLS